MKLDLCVLEGQFSIHRLPPDHEIPKQVFGDQFYSISKTSEEMSVVCSSSASVESERSESGWSCIKVLGPLDFSLTGILADISAILARAEISIFALSTFDTDYILVKSKKLPSARQALQQAGYTFRS
jgi:uncharacterized protein